MNDTPKVLLVEDKPEDTRLIREMLAEAKGASFELECADRLSTGLERLAEGEIDVVLLNLSLPDSQGLDTLAKMQAQAPQVPIVVLTELEDEELAVKAIQEGAQDYLAKEQMDSNLLVHSIRHAIGRKQAERALERRLKQLASLSRASQAVAASLELDQVLAEIVSLAGEVAASDYASVILVDEKGKLSRSAEYLPGVPRIEHRVRAEGFTQWIVRSRQPAVVDDIGEDGLVKPRPSNGAPCMANPLIVKAGIKSFVGLPLVAKDRLLGVLYLHSLRPGTFRDQLPLLTAFANQAAVAIENARIYEQERKRTTQLELLAGITQKIASILDLDELLSQVVRMIGETFGYYYTSIFMVEAESDELVMRAGAGPFDETLIGLRLKIGQEGICGWVAYSGEPLLVNDVGREPRYYSTEESKDTRSELAVPIKLKGEVIGVLDVQSVELGAFSQDDVSILQTLADQLAVAVENARLYQNERRRTAQLSVVNQVARQAASILDLEQLLQETVAAIQQRFNYYHVGLFLLDETAGELAMGAIAGGFEEVAPPDYRQAIGEGIIGRAAETGQLLLANDVSREPRYIKPGFIEESPTKAELCVPLKLAGQVIGVLDIQSTQLNAFDETDLMAMETLAGQIAVAIENAGLYQEAVRRLEETETFSAVTTALTRSLGLDQVLQTIVDSAIRLIPASTNGVLHLVDKARGELVPRATSTPGGNIKEKLGMSIGEGIAGFVVQEKRALNVPNVEENPRFLATDNPIKSLLVAPLLIGGDCIGTLSLNSDQAEAFSADDEQLLMTLAAQAAVAVRNAQLHQAVQRRVEELVFLNQVGRVVTSSLNLEQVLTAVMEATVLMLGTEAGSVLLLDEESRELVFETVVGPQSSKIKGLRLPPDMGIAGWVARTGQLLLVPDVRENPHFYPDIDETIGFITRSLLAIPLKVRGKIIGVIEAVNKTEGDFDQADAALLSSMARWAAIAIENARLFAETQRHFVEMIALHDISLEITARLEMPELLKSIMERAVGLLRADAGGVYLYDREREELRLIVGYNYTEKYTGVILKPGEGMAGKVFQTGEPFIVDDYRIWEGRAPVFEADQPFTAMLGVPLRWQERVIGALVINADTQKRTFSQNDVWLATLLANQATIAIENARLYKELQDQMEELKQTQAQLIQSAKLAAVGELAAGVAHEINNPLTSIIGFTRLLLRELDDDNPMKGDLEIIDREAARTKAIVRSLLDFARQREPQLKPADVNEVVQSTMALIYPQAKSAQVTIKESYDDTLPLISLDTDQMKQVFLNIMINAIQAMPDGGELKVVTAYRPQVQSPGDSTGLRPAGETGSLDCVAVEFHDTGTGISAEELPRIFDPFFTTKEVGQGTGLGLSISYGIVQSHGGWIEVESEVGRGSTFTVMLPVQDG